MTRKEAQKRNWAIHNLRGCASRIMNVCYENRSNIAVCQAADQALANINTMLQQLGARTIEEQHEWYLRNLK